MKKFKLFTMMLLQKNVLVTNSFTDDTVVQIVVIDFGKASKANSGKMYNVTLRSQATW